ncbi:MAG: hypothetical protein AAGF72_19385, partial [Pseudomonadota bacterium]
VQDGTTKLVEGQEYRIYIENLKENDTVTIKFNGTEYTYVVPFENASDNAETELTSQSLEAIADIINAAILTDPHSRDGNILVEYVDLATADDNSGVLIVRERENPKDDAEHVFIQFPMVSVTNGSGGEEATVIVKETSDTAVVLYDYDFRDTDDTDGLNRGIDVNSQRDGLQFGENGVALERFITFEDTTGINRSILQDAVAGQTLLGLDVLVYNRPDTNDPADEIRLEQALGTELEAYLLEVGPNILEEGPGNSDSGDMTIFDGDRGQPDVSSTDGTYSALHGDDLLFGSNGIETILGRTGDDRIIASRNFNLLDVETYDGGADIRLGADGQVIENIAEPSGLEQDVGVEVKFKDTLILKEGVDSAGNDVFDAGALFEITVSAVADDGSLAGTIDVDEDQDGLTEHTMAFNNFEVIRTLSDTQMDSLVITAAVGDIFYDNSKNEGMLMFDTLPGEGGSVQGVETVTASTNDDILFGGSQDEVLNGGGGDDTLNGGAGDDTVDGGSGNDLLIEVDMEGKKFESADGDDTYTGGTGSDAFIIDMAGDTGDDSFSGGSGDDAFNLIDLGGGPDGECDVIDGGAGIDQINLIESNTSTVSLTFNGVAETDSGNEAVYLDLSFASSFSSLVSGGGTRVVLTVDLGGVDLTSPVAVADAVAQELQALGLGVTEVGNTVTLTDAAPYVNINQARLTGTIDDLTLTQSIIPGPTPPVDLSQTTVSNVERFFLNNSALIMSEETFGDGSEIDFFNVAISTAITFIEGKVMDGVITNNWSSDNFEGDVMVSQINFFMNGTSGDDTLNGT